MFKITTNRFVHQNHRCWGLPFCKKISYNILCFIKVGLFSLLASAKLRFANRLQENTFALSDKDLFSAFLQPETSCYDHLVVMPKTKGNKWQNKQQQKKKQKTSFQLVRSLVLGWSSYHWDLKTTPVVRSRKHQVVLHWIRLTKMKWCKCPMSTFTTQHRSDSSSSRWLLRFAWGHLICHHLYWYHIRHKCC